MLTQIPPQLLRDLFAEAKKFYAAAPWQSLSDLDTYGITDPKSKTKYYASVMGQAGSFYALAMYRGKKGYQSLTLLQNEENPDEDPEDVLFEQDCIMVSFESREEIDPEDMALIEGMNIDVTGMDLLPAFRSYRPGQMPWVINEEEARILLHVLPLGPVVAERFMDEAVEGRDYLLQDDYGLAEEEDLIRFFARDEQGEWKDDWVKPDTLVDFSPLQMKVNKKVKEAGSQLRKSAGIWLVEQFYLREPVMDDSLDRPYFPKALALLDLDTQVLRGINSVAGHQMAQKGAATLLEMFQAQESIPRQLVVASKSNYALIKPVAKAFGLELHLDEEMAGVGTAIKESLYEQLAEEN